jgi:hypothetical protein
MFASSRDQVGRKPARLVSGFSIEPSAFIVHSVVEPGLRPRSDSKTILLPASDQASGMTGTVVNLSMGSLDD